MSVLLESSRSTPAGGACPRSTCRRRATVSADSPWISTTSPRVTWGPWTCASGSTVITIDAPQPASGTQRRATMLRESSQYRGIMRTLLTPQVRGRLQHLVRGLDGLGVDFIRPLPRDEIDHFFHHTDIRDFEHPLGQPTQSTLAGRPGDGVP